MYRLDEEPRIARNNRIQNSVTSGIRHGLDQLKSQYNGGTADRKREIRSGYGELEH